MSKNELEEKLIKEIQSANWNMLEPHFKRDAVFLVSGDLDLVSVGLAIAGDQADLIKGWQEKNQFRRPNESEIELWKKDESKNFAQFLIIQPYVIVKLLN